MKEKLIKYVYSKFKNENGIELPEDEIIFKRIDEACLRAIYELKSSHETEINLPFIMADSNGPKHINFKITQEILTILEIDNEYPFEKTPLNYSTKNFSSTNIDDILNKSAENNNPTTSKNKTLGWAILVLAIAAGALAFYFLSAKN